MKSLLGKSRKEDAGAPAGSTATRKAHGLSIRRMVLMAFLFALAVLVVTAGLTYRQFTQLGHRRTDALRKARTEALAGRLGGRVGGYSDIVAIAARSSALATALADHNSTVVAQRAAALGKMLPAVLGVRILPPGYSQIDSNSQPPLSYACLELIHRAETGRIPPPVEVHMFGTKGQHMAIVRPVVGAHGVAGTILVTMDADLVKKWLQPLAQQANGYVELRQGTGDRLVLAAVGDKALQDNGSMPYVAVVPGTSWQLAQWLPPPVALTAAQRMVLFAVFGFAAVVLTLGFLVLGLLCGRIVRADLVAVVKQAVEMVNGGRQHNFEARLAESREVLHALEQRIQPRQVQPDLTKAAAMREESGIVVDEDAAHDRELAPAVLFMGKDAVEVKEAAGAADDKDT